MNDKNKIKHIGGVSFAKAKAGVYALSGLDLSTTTIHAPGNAMVGDWEQDPVIFGGVKMVPYGYNNNMPAEIRELLEKNNLGPSILSRKLGLQYGQGPYLY